MITLAGLGRFFASSAVGLVFLTAACSEVVAKDNVAKTIMDQLQKQSIDAQNVTCPTDLQAIVGQTVRCSFTVDGQPVDAIATVTSVDGSNVKYDITTEARPIAKDLLARKITEQVGQQAKLPVPGREPHRQRHPQREHRPRHRSPRRRRLLRPHDLGQPLGHHPAQPVGHRQPCPAG